MTMGSRLPYHYCLSSSSPPLRYLFILFLAFFASLFADLQFQSVVASSSSPEATATATATAPAPASDPNDPVSLINKANTAIARHGKSMFLISNGVRHEIAPDRYTRDIMRQCKNPVDFPHLSREELNRFKQGPPVQSMWDHHPNIHMLSLGTSIHSKQQTAFETTEPFHSLL